MLDGNREEPWRVESSTLFSNYFFSSVAVCSKIIHQWFWRWGEVLSGTDLGKADDYDVEGSLEGEMMMMIMTMKMMMAKMQRGGEGWKGRCTSEDGPQTLHPSPQSTPQSTIPSAQSTPQCTIAPPICNALRTIHSEMHCLSSNVHCTLRSAPEHTVHTMLCTSHSALRCKKHCSFPCTEMRGNVANCTITAIQKNTLYWNAMKYKARQIYSTKHGVGVWYVIHFITWYGLARYGQL